MFKASSGDFKFCLFSMLETALILVQYRPIKCNTITYGKSFERKSSGDIKFDFVAVLSMSNLYLYTF